MSLGPDYKYVSESFETSVPWNCIENLCRNVKDHIRTVCLREGIKDDPYVGAVGSVDLLASTVITWPVLSSAMPRSHAA